MKEAELQAAVIDMAHLFGWIVAHFRPALTQSGRWVTPVQADGKGFPDLVLVRDEILYVELKSERGRLSLEQRMWIEAIRAAGGEAHLWRPTDWLNGTVEAALR